MSNLEATATVNNQLIGDTVTNDAGSPAVVLVPVTKIVTHEKEDNSRESYTEIEELASSIEQDGQITPIHVTPEVDAENVPTGRYIAVTGFRRMRAIRRLSKGGDVRDVLCQVVTLDDAGEYKWLNLLENIHRNGLTPYEQAKAFAELCEAHGWRAKDIAARYGTTEQSAPTKGMSASNINNMVRAYKQLTEKCHAAWAKQRISNDAAFKLCTMEADAQEAFLQQALGKSGQALTEAYDLYMRGPDADAGAEDGASRGTSDGGEGGKKKKKHPGPAQLIQAKAWARKLGEDAAPMYDAIRWMCGDVAKLKFGDEVFEFADARKGKSKGSEGAA